MRRDPHTALAEAERDALSWLSTTPELAAVRARDALWYRSQIEAETILESVAHMAPNEAVHCMLEASLRNG